MPRTRPGSARPPALIADTIDAVRRTGGLAAVLVSTGALFAGSLTVQGHYFVRDGKAFFWLGDTNWSLFTLYTATEADEYLEHRARQGFTVINVMMAFSGGPGTKVTLENTEGNSPFLDGNPATPNFSLCASEVGTLLEFCTDKTCVVTTTGAARAPVGPSEGGSVAAFEPGVRVFAREGSEGPNPAVPGAALALAAETVTPILLAHPELIPQVRPFLMQADIVDQIFMKLDLNGDGILTLDEMLQNEFIAPFAGFLKTPGFFGPEVDALIKVRRSDLKGDPAFLFSYEALRRLVALYVDKHGIAHALIVKLDAAEEAEERGNLAAKAGALGAFANQVSAQSGKALTPKQAQVLLTMVQTL